MRNNIYKAKYLAPASNGSNHIVSLRQDGDWECDCLGWTRHFPRIECKHISWVIDNNPEPLNLENWEKLNGKKKKTREAIAKMLESEQVSEFETNPFIGGRWKGMRGV